MQNILTRSRCLVLLGIFFAIISCERPEYRLESVRDSKRVLGIHINSDGQYEFALCPLAKSYTQEMIANECINPLVESDGSPKTFSTVPAKPSTVGARIQTGIIIAATALAAAGGAYWIGRYFVTIKAGKALGADLFVERMDLALGVLRRMDSIKIPSRMAKRLLNEDGLLKSEIRIAIKHDYTLKTLKLKDGTVLTDQKAINDEIIKWGTTKADLIRDIGNLHKKTKFADKPWGRELADNLTEGGDLTAIVQADGMTKELYDTLHSNDLVLKEVGGAFRFEEKIIEKIRRYEELSPAELKQLKAVTGSLKERKEMLAKVNKASKVTDVELDKTVKALSAMSDDTAKASEARRVFGVSVGMSDDTAKASAAHDPLIALVKTSGIGGDDIEKIDDLLISELRDFKKYLKDIRVHTADKGIEAQLKAFEKQVGEEIKSSSYLLVGMKSAIRRKHAIKKGIDGDVSYANESILSSTEVVTKEESLGARFSAMLRNALKYKNDEGKFTTTIKNHEQLVAKLAKGEPPTGTIKVDSGILKASSHLTGAGVFLSLATFKSNVLPQYAFLEASKYWDALTEDLSISSADTQTNDLYAVVKGLAVATKSKMSDEVQYFFLHTGTEEEQ